MDHWGIGDLIWTHIRCCDELNPRNTPCSNSCAGGYSSRRRPPSPPPPARAVAAYPGMNANDGPVGGGNSLSHLTVFPLMVVPMPQGSWSQRCSWCCKRWHGLMRNRWCLNRRGPHRSRPAACCHTWRSRSSCVRTCGTGDKWPLLPEQSLVPPSVAMAASSKTISLHHSHPEEFTDCLPISPWTSKTKAHKQNHKDPFRSERMQSQSVFFCPSPLPFGGSTVAFPVAKSHKVSVDTKTLRFFNPDAKKTLQKWT